MDLKSSPRWELGVAAFFIVACALILWETRTIPAGTFEPLGSAPVPQATAVLIMLLCVVVGGRAWRKLRAGGTAAPKDADARAFNAFVVAALTIVYVAILDSRAIEFAWLTALFLFVTIAFLIRLRRSGLVAAAVTALIVGWGAQYIFTRVFIVDLPGL